MHSNRVYLAIAANLMLALFVSCKGAKKPEAEDAATSVQVATATRGSIEHVITAEAVLYPLTQSSIAPKISAPIRRFLVNRGDHVRSGQLLAELDNRDLVSAVNENEALFRQAESQFDTISKAAIPEDLSKSRTDVASARQALDAAKTLFNNRTTLVREGALAQKLADDAQVSLIQAQGQFEIAQRHLESLQTVSRPEQINYAQAAVDAAKARLASAQAAVSYTQIRSPIDGIVADRPSSAGEMASSGSPIITVVNISDIVARADLPVRDAQLVHAGDNATVDDAETHYPGKVTVVSPSVDPSSTTIEVWIRARNASEKLKPGSTAKVSIRVGTVGDAVVIPTTALLSSDEGGVEVMVIDADSVAHERKVQPGVRQGDQVQIIGGLKDAERVVTLGGVGLADKAKVEVKPAQGEAEQHE